MMTAESTLWLALVVFVLTALNLARAQALDWAAQDQARRVLAWIEIQHARNLAALRTAHEAIGLAAIGAHDEANELIRGWNAEQKGDTACSAKEGAP